MHMTQNNMAIIRVPRFHRSLEINHQLVLSTLFIFLFIISLLVSCCFLSQKTKRSTIKSFSLEEKHSLRLNNIQNSQTNTIHSNRFSRSNPLPKTLMFLKNRDMELLSRFMIRNLLGLGDNASKDHCSNFSTRKVVLQFMTTVEDDVIIMAFLQGRGFSQSDLNTSSSTVLMFALLWQVRLTCPKRKTYKSSNPFLICVWKSYKKNFFWDNFSRKKKFSGKKQ